VNVNRARVTRLLIAGVVFVVKSSDLNLTINETKQTNYLEGVCLVTS